jgi:hypothetical protein
LIWLFFAMPSFSALIGGGATRRLSTVEVTTWGDLKTQCEAGGAVVSLAVSFPVDSYPGEISVSAGNKTCVIQGNGKTLDAGGGGRIFKVTGTGSSLQLHNLSLINGAMSGVSKFAIRLNIYVLKIDAAPISARPTWNDLSTAAAPLILLGWMVTKLGAGGASIAIL